MSEASSRFEAATHEGLTPMVGRETEIGMLLERWQQAQDGEGQAVLLGGEPGIGKSRILSALMERLYAPGESLGARGLYFQCSPYYTNSALYPSIDNFERALKFARDDTPDAKLDKLEILVTAHYARPKEDVRFLGAMLSLPVERRYGPLQMTPQRFKDETLRALVDITEAAARKQPSVMLFEDAHWADPTSLEVLDLLIDRVKSFPLLILITHRPEFQNRWTSHGHVSALNLSKLTKAQSSAMVDRVAKGKALPGNLKELILAKTDGVPLYVEELTKAILESKDIEEKEDRYEYRGDPSQLVIPATLRDSLMARLDRHQAMKEVAQMGAVIGREFSYELIQAIAPKTKQELDQALQQLTDSGLAFRRGTPPEATYTFKHALVQDAAYDSLLKTRRQELHGKIAHAIEEHFPAIKDSEPEVLAHHWTAAGEIAHAIPLWKLAGSLAFRRMALKDSIAHLSKGLDLVVSLPHSKDRDAAELDIRSQLGTACMAFSGWAGPDVWNSYRPALDLARAMGRTDEILSALWALVFNVMVQGRIAESMRWVDEAFAAAQATGSEDILLIAHATAVAGQFWLGNFEKVRTHSEILLSLYDDKKHGQLAVRTNTDAKVGSLIYMTLSEWAMGYPERARKISDDKDQLARKRNHPFELAWAMTFGASAFGFRREPDEYHRRIDEGERLGREHSIPFVNAELVPSQRGLALMDEGRFREAIPLLYSGVSNRPGEEGIHYPYLSAVRAEALAMSGDLDNALRLIDRQIEQVLRPGWEERAFYAEVLRIKGVILLMKDDQANAEIQFFASLECARQQKAKSWELRTAISLARLWQSQGKRQQAHDLLAPIYNWFTEGFDTKDLKDAKALLDDLS